MAFADTHPLRFLVFLLGTLTYISVQAKVFERCELAREFVRQNISHEDLGKWLCVTEQESRYDTNAENRFNWDGSIDHGIFQINNRYWCEPGGANICRIPCTKLRDDDITDDIQCALLIKQVHGMHAWAVWYRCYNRDLSDYTRGCNLQLGLGSDVMAIFQFQRIQARIFSRCEFLAELKKQNVENGKLATYMCIADVSSSFNTKSIQRSEDSSTIVGVFQISDRYWCASTGSKNFCQVPCYRFLDDDVSDDIQCARLIELREGFQAWGWALKQCEKKSMGIYINGC